MNLGKHGRAARKFGLIPGLMHSRSTVDNYRSVDLRPPDCRSSIDGVSRPIITGWYWSDYTAHGKHTIFLPSSRLLDMYHVVYLAQIFSVRWFGCRTTYRGCNSVQHALSLHYFFKSSLITIEKCNPFWQYKMADYTVLFICICNQ